MVTLNHQMSPPQHALLCADERRSALQQLMVTTETAAKLADVAHVEALAAQCKAAGGGGTDCITAETERLHAESAKIGREVERVVAETERTRAETEKVGKETEKVCKEIERAARETLRLKVEAEAERAREEVAAAQEKEDMDGEMDKGMSEAEQQTATTTPAASSSRQRGRLGVPRGSTQPSRRRRSPSQSPPEPSRRRRSPSQSPPASVLPPEEGIKIVALYEDNEMVEEIEDALEEWNSNNKEQFTLAGWAWFMHSETEAYVFLDRPGKDETHVRRPIRDRTGTIKTPRSMFRDLDIYKGYDGYIYGSRMENRKRERVKFE